MTEEVEEYINKDVKETDHEDRRQMDLRFMSIGVGSGMQQNMKTCCFFITLFLYNFFLQRDGTKNSKEDELPRFEQEQVAQARRIMKPFVLRRLKREVLKDLPTKTDATLLCPLAPSQREKYDDLIQTFSQQSTQEVLNTGFQL